MSGVSHSIISYATWGGRRKANICGDGTPDRCFTKKTVTGDDMGIKKLIGEAGLVRGAGVPFADRLAATTLKKIRSDFREVVRAEKAGKPVPSTLAIVRFVESEYNIKMCRTTVTLWLEHAQEELNGTREINGKNN